MVQICGHRACSSVFSDTLSPGDACTLLAGKVSKEFTTVVVGVTRVAGTRKPERTKEMESKVIMVVPVPTALS